MANEPGEVRPTAVPVVLQFIIVVALIEPLWVSSVGPHASDPIDLACPRVHSGDEPHYLVMLNSLVRDRDLDLANNYAAALAGGADAGRSFRAFPLDPHTSWYEGDRIVYWWEVFQSMPPRWTRDERGQFVAAPLDPADPPRVPQEQFSWHFPGLPLLLALILLPVQQPECLESLSLVATALTVVAGACFFDMLLRLIQPDGVRRGLAVAGVFLGTPIWHYARTLFTEPYQLTLAMAAYALVLRHARYAWAGPLIGIGMLMKPNFVLLAVPLVWYAWRRGDTWRGLFGLGLPVAIAIVVLLSLNSLMHGSPARPPLEWRWGNPLTGVLGLLFDPAHGLLPFAPVTLAALVAWPSFLRKAPQQARVLLLGSALFFLCAASYYTWEGGYCYGPRYLVPILPLLLAPLCIAHEVPVFHRRLAGAALLVLGSISVLISLVGAFACRSTWGRHPASLFADWVSAG